MASVTTLPPLLWPLMDGASVDTPYCCVCGRSGVPLNRHHVVRRGAGKLYRNGIEVPKPLLTLCGSGNASGCHGLAHQNRLHFRWVRGGSTYGCKADNGAGHWEYLLLDRPTKYADALEMGGWRPLRRGERWQ